MYEIDKEKFGVFLVQLRKEKGLTQKELAEKLYVSDKAVSKWERGLSLPDIALLQPLAELLGVSVTELLSGRYIHQPLTVEEVEPLVTGTLKQTVQERTELRSSRRQWGFRLLGSVMLCALWIQLFWGSEWLWDDLATVPWLPPAMALGVRTVLCLRQQGETAGLLRPVPAEFYQRRHVPDECPRRVLQ